MSPFMSPLIARCEEAHTAKLARMISFLQMDSSHMSPQIDSTKKTLPAFLTHAHLSFDAMLLYLMLIQQIRVSECFVTKQAVPLCFATIMYFSHVLYFGIIIRKNHITYRTFLLLMYRVNMDA